MTDTREYENRDARCTYPFEPNAIGYCWSYAHHVDGTSKFEDILKICEGCELWNENLNKVKTGESK